MITRIDINTVQVPFTCDDESRFRIVTAGGKDFPITSVTDNGDGTTTLVSSSDLVGTFYVGLDYTMRYDLGNLEIKTPTSGGTQSTNFATKDNLSTMTITFENTGHFDVEVNAPKRDTRVNTFTSRQLGYANVGEANLETGSFRFHVRGKTRDTKVSIVDDSVFPVILQHIEIERKISSRSNR